MSNVSITEKAKALAALDDALNELLDGIVKLNNEHVANMVRLKRAHALKLRPLMDRAEQVSGMIGLLEADITGRG